MTTTTTARTYLWLLAPLVPLALLLVWYVWLPPLLLVLLVRDLRKPEGQKVTERNWAKARLDVHQHHVKTLIQMHLAAKRCLTSTETCSPNWGNPRTMLQQLVKIVARGDRDALGLPEQNRHGCKREAG
jgi:hypothetical protein